jgi:four helix bundle protein
MTLPALDFIAFEASPPPAYAGDPIWRTRMYRMAAYLGSRCTNDVATLGARVSLHVAHQFVRAVSSLGANIAEGYSRGGAADRMRFYTYALGSAREALAWIDGLGEAPWPPREEYRDLLVQIRRQLLTAIKSLRPAAGENRRGAPKRAPSLYRIRESDS